MTHTYTRIKQEALQHLKTNLSPIYCYHSLEHTLNMLEVKDDYLSNESYSERDKELLSIAILYHDMGFIEGWQDHEQRGKQMASEVMQKHSYTKEEIMLVSRLIIATRIPQEPLDRIESIICDLDLDYLGRDDYFERSELLFQEWLAVGLVKDREEWEQKELTFLASHQFHTPYGQQHRQPVLEQHLERIRREREE